MFLSPELAIVQVHTDHGIVAMSPGLNWGGQPQRLRGGFYAVSIDEARLLELQGIEIHKDIGPNDFFKISQPRQIGGLVYANDHDDFASPIATGDTAADVEFNTFI